MSKTKGTYYCISLHVYLYEISRPYDDVASDPIYLTRAVFYFDLILFNMFADVLIPVQFQGDSLNLHNFWLN